MPRELIINFDDHLALFDNITIKLTFVQQNGAQAEPTAQAWMKQLISAVYHMHVRFIAHRDLKLENILLFADNSVKIADFGFCRDVSCKNPFFNEISGK